MNIALSITCFRRKEMLRQVLSSILSCDITNLNIKLFVSADFYSDEIISVFDDFTLEKDMQINYTPIGCNRNTLSAIQRAVDSKYSPYILHIEDDTPITSLKEMIERTFLIIKNTFDDELTKMNRNCVVSYGEINHYFVDSAYLQGYNVLNFNNGKELIDTGFEHMEHEKIKLC
jgi:hypothetical protein